MDVTEYFALLRRRWVTLLVCTLLGGSIGVGAAWSQAPGYRAEATVFLSLNRSSSVSELAQGSTYTQGLIESYVLLVQTPTVLEPVVRQLGLDSTPEQLARQVTAMSPVGTVIINIAATSASSREAATIANAVSAQLAAAVGQLAPKGAAASDSISVTTIAPALVPSDPVTPRKKLALTAGLLMGLCLGTGLVVLRELLDTKVRDEERVQQVTEAPVLGVVHGLRPGEQSLAGPGAGVGSPRDESFRRLRTNVQFMNLHRTSQVVVVTSPSAGEGKTTTAVNLAITMAEAGSRVLLIDADLRRPSVAQLLGLEPAAGLATVLAGRADLGDTVQPWGSRHLHVLAAGEVPPNPNELLGSATMVQLLESVKGLYDVVLLDSPPLLPVSDAAVLAAHADGALLVVDSRATRRKHLAASIQDLHLARARVLGVVLNRVRSDQVPSYYGSARGDGERHETRVPHRSLA